MASSTVPNVVVIDNVGWRDIGVRPARRHARACSSP